MNVIGPLTKKLESFVSENVVIGQSSFKCPWLSVRTQSHRKVREFYFEKVKLKFYHQGLNTIVGLKKLFTVTVVSSDVLLSLMKEANCHYQT